jgi:hypothetical protein
MLKKSYKDECLEAYEAIKLKGSKLKAAIFLGIPRTNLRRRYNHCLLMFGMPALPGFPLMNSNIIRDSELGKNGFDPVMPGFIVTESSAQLDKDGDTQKAWVRQRPDRKNFEMPDGHTVKGVSALLDENNRVLAKWVKTKNEDSPEELISAIKSAFDDYKGLAKLIEKPIHADEELATVYAIGDHHLGMFSWARETGEPYNLEIAESILLNAMDRLVASSPASSTGIVLNLGDFFHADNSDNRTAKSGHSLDVDTRYAKVLQLGVSLMIRCVEMAAQKHEKVIVRCLPGNHDPHTALALSVALSAFFANNHRVCVDIDPGKFWLYVHGKTMLTATHGDMARPDDMPGIIASKWAREWGATEHRYVYLGHVHHKSRGGGEGKGVIWETFQVLPPKDAWHSSMGYTAGRSMTAITHHVEHGEYCRNTISIRAGQTASH